MLLPVWVGHVLMPEIGFVSVRCMSLNIKKTLSHERVFLIMGKNVVMSKNAKVVAH
jgi:hypothetical protein